MSNTNTSVSGTVNDEALRREALDQAVKLAIPGPAAGEAVLRGAEAFYKFLKGEEA